MLKTKCGHNAAKIRYFCVQCKNCSNCCECLHIGYWDKPIKFHTSKPSEKKLNSSDRFVAAEIEVAAITKSAGPMTAAIEKWQFSSVFDGSLPYCGFEITTSPANGDKFVQQIQDITTSLNAMGALLTKDCGLHVHIDARDYNFQDIARLIKVYAAVEPIFFAMVPEYRRKSKYALSCGETYKKAVEGDHNYWETKTQLVFNTYNSYDSDGYRKSKYNDARYNALNLHSWFYRGTIEFRLMEGSIDASYITSWGILWAKMLDWVLQASDKDVAKVVSMCSKTDTLCQDVIYKMTSDKALGEFVNSQVLKNTPEPKKAKRAKKKVKRG